MGPSKRLKALQQEKSDLVARMEALLNAADDESRDLTADEEMDYTELESQLGPLDKRIEREQTFLNAQASQQPIRDLNRDTREEAVARIGRVHDAWQDDPMCGYERPREFLLDVIEAGQGGDMTPNCGFWRRRGPTRPAATAIRMVGSSSRIPSCRGRDAGAPTAPAIRPTRAFPGSRRHPK